MDGGAAGVGTSSSDFVRKLYKMLENSTDESVVRWGNEGDSFVVLENEKFTKNILPKHFKHSNFASFVRQLNKYDFHKVRHNNEDTGQSPYGAGAWEFKHPDFKMNNKDALDNIKRKAPAPRKPTNMADEAMIPTAQVDMLNSQLLGAMQQLQTIQERYTELTVHHSMLVQEVIGLQKTVVNHEHVMQNVMSFLHSVDAQRRRDSRVGGPFANGESMSQAGAALPAVPEDDTPASPLQHASKLLSETNADVILNPRHLQEMNEASMRMNGTLSTPPPEVLAGRNLIRPSSRNAGIPAQAMGVSRESNLDNLVYPVGVDIGINPMYSEHINNIPYPMPSKAPDPVVSHAEARKKSMTMDLGWIRQPQVLLVEDDPTCRRIGGKFLSAFACYVDNALDGLEAVNKIQSGGKYDLVLMDIIMPNLDGVSATNIIRQFDSTPIIAMTSNIRSDDIHMYFQHGMNDVLPKPFTKEGLVSMLEKHLPHLKKSNGGIDPVSGLPTTAISPLAHTSARQSLKEEESPAKSPATASNWNSPNTMPGVSPIVGQRGEEYPNPNLGGMYGASAIAYAPGGGHAHNQQAGHRRQISDISGGDDIRVDAKRQQMYMPMPQQQGMPPMQRPR